MDLTRHLSASFSSKLIAKPLTSDAADDEPLLGVTQVLLRPVDAAAVDELQSLPERICGMNMKTEIDIISSTFGSLGVKCTIHNIEFRSNYG